MATQTKTKISTSVMATISHKTTDTKTTTWMRNMSSKPLTEAKEQLLAHGSNFAITPKCLPIGEYNATVEQTCQKRTQAEAEEL